jgi:hypothetical protein
VAIECLTVRSGMLDFQRDVYHFVYCVPKEICLIATSLPRSHDPFYVFVHDIANKDTVVPSVSC